jgi:hypothetical protein
MESTGVYWISLFQIWKSKVRSLPGERPLLPECSETQDRRVGLSVVASSAFGGIAASFVPIGGSGLRASVAAAPSRQFPFRLRPATC